MKINPIGNYKDVYIELKSYSREYKQKQKKKLRKIFDKNTKKVKSDLLKYKKIAHEIKKEIIENYNPVKLTTNEEILHRKLLNIRERCENEIRSHGEQTSIKEGFVYIISNPSYSEWIKVGMTFDYEARLAQYNQYDPEMKYAIKALRWTDNRRLLEQALLNKFSEVSINRQGEWFNIDKDLALNIFYTTV